MNELANKVAVITGGASGIGAATAELFVREGAKVVIADMQTERGNTLVSELGPNTIFSFVEVRNEDQVKNAIDLAVSKWGRLDCMFNNAGFGGALGPLEDIPVDEFDMTFDEISWKGARYFCARSITSAFFPMTDRTVFRIDLFPVIDRCN